MYPFLKQLQSFGLLLLVLSLFGSLAVYAQETPSEPTPSESPIETVVPTDAPSETPVNSEVPSEVIPDITENPVNPSPEPSLAPEDSILPEPSLAPENSLIAEPALQLLVREFFDNGDISPWNMAANWSLVPSESGSALASNYSDGPLEYQKMSFYSLAVQARFLFESGSLSFRLRNSSAGQYSVVLDASGSLALYRGDTLLQSAQVSANTSGQWRIIRISAVEGTLRVSLDNLEVLSFADTDPLPAGSISIKASADTQLLFDDFFVWVPQAEIANYPSPTAYAPIIPSPLPPTAVPLVDMSNTIKDLSAFPPPSQEQLSAGNQLLSTLGNDNFSGSVNIAALPYTVSDNTIADTLESNEDIPTCGYGMSNTVWFTLTPSVNATYSFSTAGSDFDTIVGVYTGSSVDNLTQLSCNDDVSTTNLTSYLTVNLVSGTSYQIQVGGFNGRYGNYSLLVQQLGFAVPSAPSLLSPVNAARTNDTSPTLSWNTVLNASQYEVQWATNATFTASLQSTVVAGTTLDLPTLAGTPGTTYYWRVRALNINSQAGAFSAYRSFVLDTVPLNAPNLSLPANAAVTTDSSPTLSWVAITGASYLLDLDNDSDFSSPILWNQPVAAANYTPASSLVQGTYYWRVQSRDNATNPSVESAVRSFTIKILTAPANNAIITTGTGTANPSLSWVAVAGATGYTVQIDDDTDFSADLLVDVPVGTLLGYTVSPALTTGVYYWQVVPTGLEQTTAVYSQFTISPPALAAPSLLNPANASRTNDTTPDLEWGAVAGAFQYELQWASNATFTTGMASAIISDPTTIHTLPSLPNSAGTTYYWRVRTINNFGIAGAYSAARNFVLDTTAPVAPNLTAPANAVISTNSRPTFSWQASTGAQSYFIDIDNDSDFSSLEQSHQLASTSYTLTTPLAQGMYYWRVRVQDAAMNISASASRTITIKILTAPANNAIITTGTGDASPVLSWAAVFGVSDYTVQIDDDTDFSADLLVDLAVGNLLTYTVSPALAEGVYYWQVFPTGFAPANPVYSQFTISAPALAAPSLLSPANAAKTNDSSPNLSWNAVAGAAQYELQWATNATFTANLQSSIVATTDLDLPTLASTPGTTYYWRVRSINPVGVSGGFSAYRSFVLDTVAPAAPNLTGPANAAITTNSRPALSWTAATTATAYLIEIDDNNDFSSPIILDGLSTTTSYTPASSLPQGIYYWRVQSRDTSMNLSPESSVRSFSVKILSAPAANAVIFTNTGSAAPVFRWAAVTGATGYSFQLDDDTDFSADLLLDIPLGSSVLTYTPAGLGEGLYYWQVVPTGFEQATAVYHQLTVSPAALAAASLLNPANAAKTNDTTPNLSWNALGGAAQYELQWATNATFTAGLQSTTVATTNVDLPSLANTAGTTYYWRVRGINSLGVPGAFSAYRSFVLDTLAPAVPNLTVPANNTATSNSRPSLQWGVVTGAAYYELRYGISVGSMTTISNITTASYVPISPLLMRDYYWQVRAIDAAGNASDWTALRTVKIISLNTASPVLQRFTTSTPTLSWSPVTWTDPGGYYQVQVDNNSNFVSPEFVSGNIATGTQTVTTTSLADGTWYWRVRACTAANVCGAWSVTGVFTVEE